MFTWVPIYTELAKQMLPYRNKQSELIKMLKEMASAGLPVGSTVDYGPGDKEIELAEIDPFTFYACFNRGLKLENRCKILDYLKTKFSLKSDVPSDFSGIPIVDARRAWFFPYASNREDDDIPSLWSLAEAVVSGGPDKLDGKLFERCLKIDTVGPAKLTMGMFWLNPHQYLAADAVNGQFFQQNGIDIKVKDFASYSQLLTEVSTKFGNDYPQISRKSFEILTKPVAQVQYWAGGSYWDGDSMVEEFTNGNFWQIGWGQDDENPAAKRTWQKFEQVQVGDEFAIKGYGGTNDLKIYYVGRVKAKEDNGILHLTRLERPLFHDKGPSLTGGNWRDTLVPIKSKEVIAAIFGLDGQPAPQSTSSVASNLILYGPPGTGKTYNTIERAVRIIEPDFEGDHPVCKARFDELRAKGRIEFITFHQSYSYEDFVEGLRPVLDTDDDSGEVRYTCKPGVFKRIAVQSLFDCLKQSSPEENIVSFDLLWNRLLEQIQDESAKKYPGLTGKTSYEIALTVKGNLEGENVISGKKFLCTRSVLEKVFTAKPRNKSISSSEVMEIVVRGCHSHFVAAMFNELKRIEKAEFSGKQRPSSDAIHLVQKADTVQTFLEKVDHGGYALKPPTEWPRYVLVIDEINRGNISKILGELITLIEPDKRLGAEHSLVVTLPYTGDRFIVPGNLHILGTMNTADKSIALVDVALRRRFEFEEMRPDFVHCANLSQQMRDVLEELNRRICLRRDRDHQIGHAYFIHVADENGFNRVFVRQVIPLLQEYFFNDWEGLRFVLGEQGKQSGTFIKPLNGSNASEARTRWQWYKNVSNNDVNCLQTLSNNYQPS